MLKCITILFALFIVAQCGLFDKFTGGGKGGKGGAKGKPAPGGLGDGGGVGLPPGNCKPCDENMKSVFDLAATVAQGMEPLELVNQVICKKVIVTGIGTVCGHGKSCMISKKGDPNKWQQVGLKLKKFKVKCHIVPLNEMPKLIGVNLPIPPLVKITGEQIVVIDANELTFDITTKINFEQDSCNVTKLEVQKGRLDGLTLRLEGSGIFTKLGGIITNFKPISKALGSVVLIILRIVIKTFLSDPKLKEAITMLNCGDEDY